MKRPVLWMVLFLISGIIAGRMLSLGVAFALVGAAFFCASLLLCKRWHHAAPLLFFVAFLLGGFLVMRALLPVSTVLEEQAQKETMVRTVGQITEAAHAKNGSQRLTLQAEHITWEGGAYTGKVKLYLLTTHATNYTPGQSISCTGKLRLFSGRTAPGGFDEALYRKTRGVSYKLFPDTIQVRKGEGWSAARFLYGAKDRISDIYFSALPAREAGLIKAMVTGDKEDLDEGIQTLYEEAGITHIIAVSGMHITLVGALLFWILQGFFRLPRCLCAVLTMLILCLYLWFTGCSASGIRAVLMVCIVLCGTLVYRSGDILNSVAVAALLLLVWQPLFLWDIGFQLSFVTITGLLLGQERLEEVRGLPAIWKNTIGISWIATVCSYPLTAYHFYGISLSGLFTNLLVVPLSGILLSMGFLMGICGLFSAPLSLFFGGSVYYILQFYEAISSFFVRMPGGYLLVGQPSLLTVGLAYLLLLGLYWYQGRERYKILLSVCAGFLFFSMTANRLFFRMQTVAFLDVGQGDSIVLTTPDKRAFVIDGGGKRNVLYGKNTGNTVVVPYLKSQGISEIEGLFLTHMDMDHAAGVLELMEAMPVTGVYYSEYPFAESGIKQSFFSLAEKKKIPLYALTAGDEAKIGERSWQVAVLYPSDETEPSLEEDNRGSLILRLTYGEVSLLLTGDAGIEEEETLLEDDVRLNAQILKAGHHGSQYATGQAFLDAVAPETVIFSCGKNNPYGHPRPLVLERVLQAGAAVYSTSENGSVILRTNGKSYQIKTMPGR